MLAAFAASGVVREVIGVLTDRWASVRLDPRLSMWLSSGDWSHLK